MQKPEAAIKIPVEEFTSAAPITAEINTPIRKVYDLMREHGVRHVPIVENNQPKGIISDRDLKLFQTLDKEEKLEARHIMSPDPYLVSIDATLDEVALAMSEQKIGSALVTEKDGSLYGIFTATDALNALVEVLRQK